MAKPAKHFPGYEILLEEEIKDFNSRGLLLRHKKTGARVVMLENDDENKVFYIGFRTPPVDSTGSAHIVEHTVLCGSEKYPLKDPFVELVKGSLNTFLNAMTYPDKTVYPLASCNDKDFRNLVDVYMDAVLHPNIYHEEKIFLQEGWHYELESPEDDLTINGVVYNEMKGAFSSPDDLFSRTIMDSLFPDTEYGFESGGDPDVIPELTYQMFLDFHSRYYHPSNSYIYLYGNMDMEEYAAYLDREYLSKYEAQPIESSLHTQTPFTEVKEVVKTYPISDAESGKEGVHFALSKVVSGAEDIEKMLAFSVLDFVIGGGTASVVKKALQEKGIGKSVYSSLEDGILQPYFSIVCKNTEESEKEAFLETVEETLRKMVEEGIDKKSLYAAINSLEFRYREADFGSYPKGLIVGLGLLDEWLFDDMRPFEFAKEGELYKSLRAKVETDYFEELIRTELLENKNGTLVIMKPEKGLAAAKEEQLRKKLEERKNSLSEGEIEKLIEETAALKEYQEERDSQEVLDMLPKLTREDLKKEADKPIYTYREVEGLPIVTHDVFTGGISYLKIHFGCSNLPLRLLPYLKMSFSLLGYLDLETMTYGELENEILIRTGGLGASATTLTKPGGDDDYALVSGFSAKVLTENIGEAFDLALQIIKETKFDDTDRIHTLLKEANVRAEEELMTAGHSVASARATSYFSEFASVNDLLGGLGQYFFLRELTEHFEERKEEVVASVKEVLSIVICPENMLIDCTAPAEADEEMIAKALSFRKALAEDSDNIPATDLDAFCNMKEAPVPEKKQEGFMNAAQVQYVAIAGSFRAAGLPYHASLNVLRVLMGYDYLWNRVRVTGGAYGCMSRFSRNGQCAFVSYRDPNLDRTLQVYREAADYLETWEGTEEELTQYVIGAIGSIDTPKTPRDKGAYGFMCWLDGDSFERIQQSRDQLIGTTKEDIRMLSVYIRAFVEQNNVCVVGNEDRIMEAEEELNKIHLFQGQEDE